MGGWQNEPITGVASGVPFTALPPAVAVDDPVPLVLTWHMLDAPCTDAAFAAALPLAGVPAWRVHLGMPLCGARMREGGMDAIGEHARRDAAQAYVVPVVRQAVEEFPAALSQVREQLAVGDGPLGLVGGSLGGMVVLQILAEAPMPIAAAALVNPAVRARSVVELIEDSAGRQYPWTAQADKAVDQLDFVARAGDIAARTPRPALLVLSGELDIPVLRTDAVRLCEVLRERYKQSEHVQLTTVPDLAHPLAEPPGLDPAPQLPLAKVVDEAITQWFLHYLPAR